MIDQNSQLEFRIMFYVGVRFKFKYTGACFKLFVYVSCCCLSSVLYCLSWMFWCELSSSVWYGCSRRARLVTHVVDWFCFSFAIGCCYDIANGSGHAPVNVV